MRVKILALFCEFVLAVWLIVRLRGLLAVRMAVAAWVPVRATARHAAVRMAACAARATACRLPAAIECLFVLGRLPGALPPVYLIVVGFYSETRVRASFFAKMSG